MPPFPGLDGRGAGEALAEAPPEALDVLELQAAAEPAAVASTTAVAAILPRARDISNEGITLLPRLPCQSPALPVRVPTSPRGGLPRQMGAGPDA